MVNIKISPWYVLCVSKTRTPLLTQFVRNSGDNRVMIKIIEINERGRRELQKNKIKTWKAAETIIKKIILQCRKWILNSTQLAFLVPMLFSMLLHGVPNVFGNCRFDSFPWRFAPFLLFPPHVIQNAKLQTGPEKYCVFQNFLWAWYHFYRLSMSGIISFCPLLLNWFAFSKLHKPLFTEHGFISFPNTNPPLDKMNNAYCKVRK